MAPFPGKKIIGNIILNGKGIHEGTNDPSLQAEGIYIDDHSADVEIIANTVYNCSNNGIKIHNASHIKIEKNTVFNNGTQITLEHDSIAPNNPINNIEIEGNIFYAKLPSQYLFRFSTIKNEVNTFGGSDRNYFARPFDNEQAFAISYVNNEENISKVYNLKAWQSSYNQDINSKGSPATVNSYRLISHSKHNKFINSSFSKNIADVNDPAGSAMATWNGSEKIDGGSLQISNHSPGAHRNITYMGLPIGQLDSGKNYLLRFVSLGSIPNQALGTFLSENYGTYAHLTKIKYQSLFNYQINNEVLFTTKMNVDNASIGFEIFEGSETFWLDNMQFYEANAIINNPNDYYLFLYNASKVPRSFPLNGTYLTVDNLKVTNKITVQPYHSIVLLKAIH